MVDIDTLSVHTQTIYQQVVQLTTFTRRLAKLLVHICQTCGILLPAMCGKGKDMRLCRRIERKDAVTEVSMNKTSDWSCKFNNFLYCPKQMSLGI